MDKENIYIYNGILFNHKKREVLQFGTKWMDPEGIILALQAEPSWQVQGEMGLANLVTEADPQEKLGSPQPKIHLKDWDKCGFSPDRTP